MHRENSFKHRNSKDRQNGVCMLFWIKEVGNLQVEGKEQTFGKQSL